jgi:hypothetical protein
MAAPDSTRRSRALGGLLVRREGWRLSLAGRLLSLVLLVALVLGGLRGLYPFLAVNDPQPAEILVIDGWLPTYDLNRAADEFRRGHYQLMLIASAVYEFTSIDQDPGNAEMISRIMNHDGVPRDRLAFALFPGFQKDRTYYSARAVGDWLAHHQRAQAPFNLATLGPHARRSRLLYAKALGSDARFGVIALDDPAYDPRHWWRFSEGVREVLFEGVAYVYARFIFSSPPG